MGVCLQVVGALGWRLRATWMAKLAINSARSLAVSISSTLSTLSVDGRPSR